MNLTTSLVPDVDGPTERGATTDREETGHLEPDYLRTTPATPFLHGGCGFSTGDSVGAYWDAGPCYADRTYKRR